MFLKEKKKDSTVLIRQILPNTTPYVSKLLITLFVIYISISLVLFYKTKTLSEFMTKSSTIIS